MTTKIADRYAQLDGAVISAGGAPDTVYVGVDKTSQPHNVDVLVDRAEFLAAVATELDVIIIPRADLPEVKSSTNLPQLFTAAVNDGAPRLVTANTPIAKIRAEAYASLAIAEHLEKHPPIDEAQVDALARVLADTSLDNRLAKADIRALVAAGVRAPQAGDPK